MNTKKLISALITAAVITTGVAGCSGNNTSSDGSQQTTESTTSGVAGVDTRSVLTEDIAADTVIARATSGDINMEITFGEFIKEYKYYLASNGMTDDVNPYYASTLQERREYIVNYLINEKIVRAKFEELGYTLSEEDMAQIASDAEASIANIKASLVNSIGSSLAEGTAITEEELNARAEEQFNNLLTSCGLTVEDMHGWQESSHIQNLLNKHVNKDFELDYSEAEAQVAKVAADAKTMYESDPSAYDPNAYKAVYIPEGSRYVKHILLKFEDGVFEDIYALREEGKDADADKLRDEKIAEMQSTIDTVEGKVASGEDFDTLMGEYSGDGDTTVSYLISPDTGLYMDGFAETAMDIAELNGTASCITDYGYHIIKYVSEAVVTEDDIKKTTDGIYQYLIEATQAQNFSKSVKEWREAYSFEIERDILLLAAEETAEADTSTAE